MFTAWAVASFAGDSVLEKWWIAIAILSAEDGANLTGVALETTGLDGSGEADFGVVLVAGGCVPLAPLRVPGDGQFKEIAFVRVKVGSACSVRADEVIHRYGRAGECELIVGDLVFECASGEGSGGKGIYATARLGHGRAAVGLANGCVAGPAKLAADKNRDCGRKHKGKADASGARKLPTSLTLGGLRNSEAWCSNRVFFERSNDLCSSVCPFYAMVNV